MSCFLFFFFLSLRLFLWSTEALWVHFPVWASKVPSRRHSVPSPHREGAWGLREQSKPCAGALLAFCVNQGISASSSPLLSYHRLRTTRFQSIKGPQQRSKCLLISWSQSPSAVILESKKIKFLTCFHSFPMYLPWSNGTRCHDLHFLNVEF